MNKRIRVRAAMSTMLAVATLGSYGTVAALAGSEPPRETQIRKSTAETPANTDTAAQPSVERQSGIVMEGSAELNGTPIAVTVYENSLYGNSIQLVLGDPEDDHIGHVEQQAPFVVDGHLAAEVRLDGDVVALFGTVEATGRPERSTEPTRDAGEQIVSRGTHTQLATDVTLSWGGEQVAVTFAPAFAYDLEVQRVDLYGG